MRTSAALPSGVPWFGQDDLQQVLIPRLSVSSADTWVEGWIAAGQKDNGGKLWSYRGEGEMDQV